MSGGLVHIPGHERAQTVTSVEYLKRQGHKVDGNRIVAQAPTSQAAKEMRAAAKSTSAETAAAVGEKGRIGKIFSKVGSVPKGAHSLIADTFKRSGSAPEATSKLGKLAASAGVRTGASYAAAAGSGGLSAWLTHKFLPESIQGTLRKVAVGGAGVGGSFIPSLVKKFIIK
jgi:hypothetical protein